MANIYKENRVDLRPFSPGQVANIRIQTQQNSTPQHRARFSGLAPADDTQVPVAANEDEFASRYLAKQGSLYFRNRRAYPRSFLWRVVDGSRVLEVQCADLTKSSTVEQHEFSNTLRLDFEDEIVPCGVAFADLEDHEVLSVFVITAARQLYTLTLRPEFFRRISSIDENVSDWCKVFSPAPLTFSYPHRLHASSPLELFVSLDNGSLLHLTRRAGDDGSHWSPLTFDERTWGSSFRGLMRWHAQPSIKYQGRNLDPNVATSIATTSDRSYVFTVCLSHTLKIWNLTTKKLVASRDLLDRSSPSSQPDLSAAYTLNPSDSSFIRVFNAERAMDGGHRYYVVTYSPYEDGRFKFWAVMESSSSASQLQMDDLFPNAVLRPIDPDPSGSMFWSIADFDIKPMEEGKRLELWVLWRNNSVYQLHTLHFDFQTLVADWSSNWLSTALETLRLDTPPVAVVSDVVDPTDKWLKFFFQPGRFQPEVLETALVMYQEALKPLSSASLLKGTASLPERLCATLTSTVTLRKYAEDDMDFTRFSSDVDSKWRQYWQIVDDLNRGRSVPLSLAYDSYNDLIWVLMADQCAAIRECSATELLLHNSGPILSGNMPTITDRWTHRNVSSEISDTPEQASYLISAASDFTGHLTPEHEAACRAALAGELFSEPSTSVADRLEEFLKQCNFEEHISDHAYGKICSALEEQHLSISSLPVDAFYAIINTLPPRFYGKDPELLPTHFGVRLTVSGTQESIFHTRQIFFDLLILVAFWEWGLNQDGPSTDVEDLFHDLIDILREYEILFWLCSNVRKCPAERLSSSTVAADDMSPGASSSSLKPAEKGAGGGKNMRLATILEDVFAVQIKPRQIVGRSQSYTLTLGIRDVLSWVTRSGVDLPNVLVHIQCNLLENKNIDLAYDFLRFQPSTPWATYAKGRLYVAMAEFDMAALHFQKAAYLLSCGMAIGDLREMSSGLLDLVEVASFNNGLPRYFQHILSIFEQVHSFSHVADFASLALLALDTEQHAAKEDAAEYTALRSDLLSRLFHASLTTCQFDQAYSAVSRYQDVALQRSALGSLITGILTTFGPGTSGLNYLLRLPTALFPNIASYVDETLLSLAKKQSPATTTITTATGSSAPDYARVLQAYRISRNDYRGAAELVYANIQRLRSARDGPPTRAIFLRSSSGGGGGAKPPVEEDDYESETIRREMLTLINLLCCLDKSEAYILVEQDDVDAKPRSDSVLSTSSLPRLSSSSSAAEAGTTSPSMRRQSVVVHADDDGNVSMTMDDSGAAPDTHGSKPFAPGAGAGAVSGGGWAATSRRPRRAIVTLDHLRREYQAELDRVSRIERGDWEFGAVGATDEDGLDDTDDTVMLTA